MLERGSWLFGTAKRLVPKGLRPAVLRSAQDLQDAVGLAVPNLLLYGQPDMFSQLDFELNGPCNLRCWYCPNSVAKMRTGQMSDEVFGVMVDQLSTIGRGGYAGVINPAFYGEPTVYRGDLVGRMAEMKDRLPRAKVWLHTNGVRLTTELFRDLYSVGVDRFIITSHPGASTKSIDRLRSELTSVEKEKVFDRTLDSTRLWNRPPHIKIPPERVLHLERCRMAATHLVIDQTGKALFCFQDFEAQNVYGDIMKSDIKTIWNSERYKRDRDNARHGLYTLAICRQCMDLDG